MVTLLLRPACIRLGAEEQDSENLRTMITSMQEIVHDFELRIFESQINYTLIINGCISSSEIIPLVWTSPSLRLRVFKAFFLEGAVNYYLRQDVIDVISRKIGSAQVDSIVSLSNALIGLNKFFPAHRHISRSSNFEPLHYLGENSFSWKTPLVFVLKIYSTIVERMGFDILSISPKDFRFYNKFPSLKKLFLLPLCQLPQIMEKPLPKPSVGEILEVGFLGSTYNVSHNEKCFDYLLSTIAPACKIEFGNRVRINIYGAKAREVQVPENLIIHGWVENLETIFIKNQAFVVPYFGGMGQQSKVFEPLSRGKLVIANPEALSGYGFSPRAHYLKFESVTDFINAIQSVLDSPNLIVEIGNQARVNSEKLFSINNYLGVLNKVLCANEE